MGIPYLAFIAGLFHGIEATSCEAERNISALTHLFGYLRINILTSREENIMFIRVNSHLMDEVRGLDAAVEQARARAVKNVHKSVAVQEKRSNITIR